MPTYMVERDLPVPSIDRLQAANADIALAIKRLAARGKQVSYLRCILVPEESRAVCLFESATAELVREVNEEAQVPFVRILQVNDFVLQHQNGLETTVRQ